MKARLFCKIWIKKVSWSKRHEPYWVARDMRKKGVMRVSQLFERNRSSFVCFSNLYYPNLIALVKQHFISNQTTLFFQLIKELKLNKQSNKKMLLLFFFILFKKHLLQIASVQRSLDFFSSYFLIWFKSETNNNNTDNILWYDIAKQNYERHLRSSLICATSPSFFLFYLFFICV